MTTSQVIEQPVEMPVIGNEDNDGFCHCFKKQESVSVCGMGRRNIPGYCHTRDVIYRQGMKTCPCGRTICPDCVAEVEK